MKRWRISWELKSLTLELENTVTENIDLINAFNRLGTTDEITEPAKILRLKLRKKKDEKCRKHGQCTKESQKDGRERTGKKNIWRNYGQEFSKNDKRSQAKIQEALYDREQDKYKENQTQAHHSIIPKNKDNNYQTLTSNYMLLTWDAIYI